MTTGTRDDVRRGVQRVRDSTALGRAARVGLLARAGCYLILGYLAARVALGLGGGSASQTNANGALSTASMGPLGRAVLIVAVVGFFAFGILRLAGAFGDGRTGPARRIGTAGQAVVYLALGAFTASFLFGRLQAGTEQQQQRTAARVLSWPGGAWLVAGIGLALITVGLWQVWVGVHEDYTDSLDVEAMPPWLRTVTRVVGSVGIVARAVAFLPIGVFLLLAAVRYDARQAKGLDELLLELARTGWGRVLVALVAAGFLVFACYTFLEARYRDISAGH